MTNTEKLFNHLNSEIDKFVEENSSEMTTREVLIAIINLLVSSINRSVEGDKDKLVAGVEWALQFIVEVAGKQLDN